MTTALENLMTDKLANRKEFFTLEDVDRTQDDYTGKMIVICHEGFKEQYRTPQFQLMKYCNGFGCDPEKLGTKVFGVYLADGSHEYTRRNRILGVIKPTVANELDMCPCGDSLPENPQKNDDGILICDDCK